MSDFSQSNAAKPVPKKLSEALAELRAPYREREAPPLLEEATLAQMRAARERYSAANSLAQSTVANAAKTTSTAHGSRVKTWLQSVFSNRWSSALAGSLATMLLATVTSPLWLSYARESVEVATPFMLVNQPETTAQLDVAQMLRVNVTREAMLDFGIPVPPQRLQEEVKAEMLMGHRGELLAVRFVEREREKRWRWQLY
jgi:hypothetical protein